MGWGYRGALSSLLLSAVLAGCTIDTPYAPATTTPDETPPDGMQSVDPDPSQVAPDAGRPEVDAGSSTTIPMQTTGGCTEGAMRTCGPQTVAGNCRLGTRTCQQGVWSECDGAVMPSARDCSSPLDNDCDGLPDNTVDDDCHCTVEMREPCETHPGFDGNGSCTAGERTCVLSPDRQSSNWGECTGAVGPVPQDSCTVAGDDSDCDGRLNGNCACIEGTVADCGPPVAAGICKKGKMTCVNGRYGDCIGATYAKARDCTSAADNDCNGLADNTVDATCTCAVGGTQACGTHPGFDNVGLCKAGTQTCVASADKRTSAFNTCAGSVGPAPRNCTLATDNDCNGLPDSTPDAICACPIGTVVTGCLSHPGNDGFGICHAGQALCIAGPNNSSSSLGACTGSVGPLAADSCTVALDDSNCNGLPNDTCQCLVNSSCPSASASRCLLGVCLACASNADCSHIPGLGVCSAGTCVQCTATSAAACTILGQVCDAATSTCVAAPPPPPPPPPTP